METNILATPAESLDNEKISTEKTRHLRMNSRTSKAIMLNGEAAKEVNSLPAWDAWAYSKRKSLNMIKKTACAYVTTLKRVSQHMQWKVQGII